MRFDDDPESSLDVPDEPDVNLENSHLRELLEGCRDLPGSQVTRSRMKRISCVEPSRATSMRQQTNFCRLTITFVCWVKTFAPVCADASTCHSSVGGGSWKDIVMRVAAAQAVNCRAIVSAPEGVHEDQLRTLHDMTESWAGDIEFVQQSDQELIEAVEWGGVSRLRYASPDRVPMSVRKAVMDRYVHVADTPVCSHGRIELMWYVQEQSISSDYHRYGNLGLRAQEVRAAVQ